MVGYGDDSRSILQDVFPNWGSSSINEIRNVGGLESQWTLFEKPMRNDEDGLHLGCL